MESGILPSLIIIRRALSFSPDSFILPLNEASNIIRLSAPHQFTSTSGLREQDIFISSCCFWQPTHSLVECEVALIGVVVDGIWMLSSLSRWFISIFSLTRAANQRGKTNHLSIPAWVRRLANGLGSWCLGNVSIMVVRATGRAVVVVLRRTSGWVDGKPSVRVPRSPGTSIVILWRMDVCRSCDPRSSDR